MGSRKAYPLCAEAYRALLSELHTNKDLRERMPVAARVGIYLMYLCGMRIGEVCASGSGWVERSKGGLSIVVPSSETSSDEWGPKTEAGARSVPVPGSFTDYSTGKDMDLEAQDVIDAYFRTHSEFGRERESMRYWMFEAADAAGLYEWRDEVTRTVGPRDPAVYPDVIPHDGRASWCAQCLRSDINRYTVRDWGGWSDMTMINWYASFVGDPSGEKVEQF